MTVGEFCAARSEWFAARAEADVHDAALIAASAARNAATDYDALNIARGQFEAALYDWGTSYDRLRKATQALADNAIQVPA